MGAQPPFGEEVHGPAEEDGKLLFQLDEFEESNRNQEIDEKVDIGVGAFLSPRCGSKDPKPLDFVLLAQRSKPFPIELDHALNLSPSPSQGQLNHNGHDA